MMRLELRLPAPSRRWRPIVLLAFAAMLPTPSRAQSESDPPYPPPGRMVDVGGWRLHIECAGQLVPGRPTVVLEAGAGDFSVDWSLVQPGVAAFTHVCAYDRSDEGWSDWGPHPRTLHQDAYELHTLLERAGERPPFVLVGHSYGASVVRVYASMYRPEVAGLVLIEGGLDNPMRMLPDGKLVRNATLVSGKPIPPVKTSHPLRPDDIPPAALAAMKAAATEMTPHANDPPRDRLPADAQRMRSWAYAQVKHYGIADNPVEPEELAALAADDSRSRFPYGDMPLAVLVRGRTDDAGGTDTSAAEVVRRHDFATLAALSRRGRLVIAALSGHDVPLDQPDLVIAEIRRTCDASRRSRR